MVPPLQSLVKYDNAVLVSSAKEKKVKDKLLKVPLVVSAMRDALQGELFQMSVLLWFCSQVACCQGSTKLKLRRLKTS